jgi:hypothetical protein
VQEPAVAIFRLGDWPIERIEVHKGWRCYLKQVIGWVEGKPSVFIFDEAQTSYWDGDLWNAFIKSIHNHDRCCVIAFASYGSPTSSRLAGTPIFIHAVQKITLCPIDHKDSLPTVRLFFSQAEFNDLVSLEYRSPPHHFHQSFFDKIFVVMNGHIGAIKNFISIILEDNVSSFRII